MYRGRIWVVCLVLLIAAALPADAGTNVPTTLTGTVHWTLVGSPYQLTGDTALQAGATLTVDPGVLVVAPQAATLTISGALNIAATSAQPVFFSPATGLPPGGWKGVVFASGSTAQAAYTTFRQATTNVTVADGATVSFTNCQFNNATQDGVMVSGNASFAAQGCTFGYDGRRGLYVETAYPRGSVTNCTFRYSGEYPIWAKANCLDMLGTGLKFYANAHQSIAVNCSASTDVQRSQTWVAQPVPLDLTPGSTKFLVLPAGVTLTLPAPQKLICRGFTVAGSLLVGTTGSGAVTLTGPSATRGSWSGISVSSGGAVNLTGATLSYATTGIIGNTATITLVRAHISWCQYDAVNLTGACTLNATGSYLQNNGRYGLALLGPVTGSVTGTYFTSNGSYPVYALAASVACLGASNKISSNVTQAIGVSCALEPDLTASATWSAQSVAYDLTANPGGSVLSIGAAATLSLNPGVTLWGGGVDVHGQLQAVGTSTQPVSFLPKGSTTPGSWNGIAFDPGSGGLLSWCRVYRAITGAVVQSASPRLEHTEFRYSSGPGVTCSGTAAPTLFHCRVSDNGGVGVYVTGTANPDLGNLSNADTTDHGGNTLMGNKGYDLQTLSSATILAQNNYWGTTSPHVGGSVNYTPLALTGVAPASAGVALLGVTASQAAGGSVAIRYCLAAPAWVSLEVVNLAGRTVRRLPAPAPSEAGERLLLWDARSDGGQRLPPGKYFVTISAYAADGTAARQMVPLALRP